jgi:radical S-adenosyl methionine domain-containing protein 2
MKIQIVPPTVNLHVLAACNYHCGFCYAGFVTAQRQLLPQEELHEILRQISSLPAYGHGSARKVTFAGGEPLLSRTIVEDIALARQLGLVTSLVTNGALLTEALIHLLTPALDWLTLSIDSASLDTSLRIGRAAGGVAQTAAEHLAKIHKAQRCGIRVKINTVVNRANVSENFEGFIRNARPHRWKMIQATRIEQENSQTFDQWSISADQFRDFVSRHAPLAEDGIVMVPERQSDVYGTYAMVGPNGCFFDNSQGVQRYSRRIVEVGIAKAWSEISFSWQRFRARGGDYDFTAGGKRTEVLQ